ncbi:hypothetical protein [Amphibacillus xylanus]|uniref:Uncharacterized protein n=1 Tax=Amphibacillus xylanus (strain ATCC 51415 / DSM 6626 / JCM 7361 / LMG 17667 / NBRC 15112 / Ep01) TaxID=698758 RepID=K0J0R8_AMPXN|nr:hypothetical protein [Amphibacillus xylanus]BAM48409.1 hypothetical protein AXY_22770 [Amphibacillus xylanus NBRC 15112]
MIKNMTKSGLAICVAIITAFVGLILYIITSTTGYLAGSVLDPLPIIFTVVAIILACLLVGVKNKFSSFLIDLSVFATAVLLIASFSLFVLGRISLAADVYFIPVNYPEAEETALNISIVGLASYMISIISMIVVAFSDKIKNA